MQRQGWTRLFHQGGLAQLRKLQASAQRAEQNDSPSTYPRAYNQWTSWESKSTCTRKRLSLRERLSTRANRRKMHRSKPGDDGRFRAPQFAINDRAEARSRAAALAATELAELFAPRPAAAAEAPAVVVKRRRQPDAKLLVDAAHHAAPAPASDLAITRLPKERSPRVFTVARHTPDTGANAPVEGLLEDIGPQDSGEPAGTPTPAAVRARRQKPEFQRPGVVTIVQSELPAARQPNARVASLAELESELASISQVVDGFRRVKNPLELDLTINDRWSRVENSLESLEASIRSR